jgi:hypothetical protein
MPADPRARRIFDRQGLAEVLRIAAGQAATLARSGSRKSGIASAGSSTWRAKS